MLQVDVVVHGTGLTESIVAAALSKAGFSVAHVDANAYYGGDEASLTLDELIKWADERAGSSTASSSSYLSAQRARFSSVSRSSTTLAQSRQYSLSLSPAIIPSIGPLIDALIASGVSRYGGFKLLERVAIYDRPGYVKTVPGSKEDVFKNKSLSLLEKRRLMRFLLFASGEFEGKKELEGNEQAPFFAFLKDAFSLDDQSAEAIAFAVAFCTSTSDTTLPALQRIRRYLRSSGRYGPSPFLVGHYGGLGEIAQGFCRTSAVNGATYILGRNTTPSLTTSVTSVSDDTTVETKDGGSSKTRRYVLQLEDLPEQLACDVILSTPDYTFPQLAPQASTTASAESVAPVVRCIAIVDRPLIFTSEQEPGPSSQPPDDEAVTETDEEPTEDVSNREVDTALLVFPPSSLPNGSAAAAVNVLVVGESCMSAPRGKWVLHLSMPLLDATTQTAEEILQPYLDATLSLTASASQDSMPVLPIFTLFYIQHPPQAQAQTQSSTHAPTALVIPPSSTLFPEVADSTATAAERVFWNAVQTLKAMGVCPHSHGEDGREIAEVEVDSFWPPLDSIADDAGDEW